MEESDLLSKSLAAVIVLAFAVLAAAPSDAEQSGATLRYDATLMNVELAQLGHPTGADTEPALDIDEDEFLDEEAEDVEIADPLSGWNRIMYHVNDKFYFWILKPVSRGYGAVVPEDIRVVIKNFFRNLAMPIRFVNSLLQGKVGGAGAELARFAVNTTVGVGGLAEPATEITGLKPSNEDTGQTLGAWGIGNGFYIVWPILGPSTLRDSFGLVGDWFLDPVSYVNPAEKSVGIKASDTVNTTSFRIGDYEALKAASLDPYLSLRDAYIQNRATKVAQ